MARLLASTPLLVALLGSVLAAACGGEATTGGPASGTEPSVGDAAPPAVDAGPGPAPTSPCLIGGKREAGDGCNTCVCEAANPGTSSTAGAWRCTRSACNACTPGATKPSPDGCNTCTCSGAGWACTERGCPPSPPVGDAGPPVPPARDAAAPPVEPRGCGARLGDTCAATEYCAYEAGQYCGAADATAVCKPRPDGCSKEYAPVCGCDNKTYGTACTAAIAGVGVLRTGPCAAGSG